MNERQRRRAATKLRARLAAALACAAAIVSARPLTAHPSFSSEFDAAQPVRLEGTISRLEWRNPHAWLYVAVPDREGRAVTWAIEASTPSALARRGLRAESLPPGTRVIVTGYRAKNGAPMARGGEIALPDGRRLALASPDAVSPDDR